MKLVHLAGTDVHTAESGREDVGFRLYFLSRDAITDACERSGAPRRARILIAELERQQREITRQQREIERLRRDQLNTRLERPGPARVAQTFAAHLAIECPAAFTFLLDPSIDATNWRAEHALRPAVVTRKVSGGNRTVRGAYTQAVLASLLRTIAQRRLDAGAVFHALLCAPQPHDVLVRNVFAVESTR